MKYNFEINQKGDEYEIRFTTPDGVNRKYAAHSVTAVLEIMETILLEDFAEESKIPF